MNVFPPMCFVAGPPKTERIVLRRVRLDSFLRMTLRYLASIMFPILHVRSKNNLCKTFFDYLVIDFHIMFEYSSLFSMERHWVTLRTGHNPTMNFRIFERLAKDI